MRALLLAALLFLCVASGAAAQEARWLAPEGLYSLSYTRGVWVVIPNRDPADQHVLRLAPPNFNPASPQLCEAVHYPLPSPPGWEDNFPNAARTIAEGINEQTAPGMFDLPGLHVERVTHADVGNTAVADVYMTDVPINGVVFKIHYRTFAVRSTAGPIMVLLNCKASEAMGPDVFRGLDLILNSLRIPG